MENTVINIQGMTCMGCVNSVTRVLQQLPGVNKVEVSLDKAQAAIQYDPAKASAQDFKTAIEDAGFAVNA